MAEKGLPTVRFTERTAEECEVSCRYIVETSVCTMILLAELARLGLIEIISAEATSTGLQQKIDSRNVVE